MLEEKDGSLQNPVGNNEKAQVNEPHNLTKKNWQSRRRKTDKY
jgi:hypothetical protein